MPVNGTQLALFTNLASLWCFLPKESTETRAVKDLMLLSPAFCRQNFILVWLGSLCSSHTSLWKPISWVYFYIKQPCSSVVPSAALKRHFAQNTDKTSSRWPRVLSVHPDSFCLTWQSQDLFPANPHEMWIKSGITVYGDCCYCLQFLQVNVRWFELQTTPCPTVMGCWETVKVRENLKPHQVMKLSGWIDCTRGKWGNICFMFCILGILYVTLFGSLHIFVILEPSIFHVITTGLFSNLKIAQHHSLLTWEAKKHSNLLSDFKTSLFL